VSLFDGEDITQRHFHKRVSLQTPFFTIGELCIHLSYFRRCLFPEVLQAEDPLQVILGGVEGRRQLTN